MAKHGESPSRSSAQADARGSDGSLPAIHLSRVRDAIAFAVEHGDNFQIPVPPHHQRDSHLRR